MVRTVKRMIVEDNTLLLALQDACRPVHVIDSNTHKAAEMGTKQHVQVPNVMHVHTHTHTHSHTHSHTHLLTHTHTHTLSLSLAFCWPGTEKENAPVRGKVDESRSVGGVVGAITM